MSDANILKEYGVEQFLYDISSASNSVLHNKATYRDITVKGKVTATTRTDSGSAFITLKSEDEKFAISARWDNCVDFKLPHKHSYIAFKGYPIIKPDHFTKSGLQISLVGTPVGEYIPEKKEYNFVELKGRTKRITLADWLENNSLNNLLIVGSEIGIGDLLGQFTSSQNLKTKLITVGNLNKFCKEFDNAISHDTKAIIITRGGDDTSIKIFDRPEMVNHLISKGIPFYTGIGHNTLHLLVEKYSDQAFPTPSAIGSAIDSHLKLISKARKLNTTVVEQNKNITALNKELDDLKLKEVNDESHIYDLSQTINKQKNHNRLLAFALIVICLIMSGFFIFKRF